MDVGGRDDLLPASTRTIAHPQVDSSFAHGCENQATVGRGRDAKRAIVLRGADAARLS